MSTYFTVIYKEVNISIFYHHINFGKNCQFITIMYWATNYDEVENKTLECRPQITLEVW